MCVQITGCLSRDPFQRLPGRWKMPIALFETKINDLRFFFANYFQFVLNINQYPFYHNPFAKFSIGSLFIWDENPQFIAKLPHSYGKLDTIKCMYRSNRNCPNKMYQKPTAYQCFRSQMCLVLFVRCKLINKLCYSWVGKKNRQSLSFVR